MFANDYTVQPTDDVSTILENAGLDWSIQRCIPAIRPLGYVPGKSDHAEFEPQDGYRFLRRSDNGVVFGPVTAKYHPHQNKDIIGALYDCAHKLGTSMTRVGSLRGGRMVFAQLDLDRRFKLGKQDEVKGLLTITTKHDGLGATRAGGTTISIICSNAFMAATAQLQGVISHRSLFESNVAQVQQALANAAGGFERYKSNAIKLAATPVPNNQVLLDWIIRLTDPATAAKLDAERKGMPIPAAGEPQDASVDLETILAAQEQRKASQALTEELLNRQGRGVLEGILEGVGQDDPARKGTWWGAVSGVTYYTTHTAQARNPENRMASAMVGPNAQLGRRALELALLQVEAQTA